MDKCPICGSPANIIDNTFRYSYLIVTCYRCGKYKIEEEVIQFEIENNKLSPEQIANISGWIRENQGSKIYLTEEIFKPLMTLKTLLVPEKADKILKYLAKQFPVAGIEIHYPFDDLLKIRVRDEKEKESWSIPKELLPIFGVGYIVNSEELHFIWEDYLINEKKYISAEQPRIIMPAGWAHLKEISRKNVSLHIVSYIIDYFIQKEEISNFPKTLQMVIDIKQTYERTNNLELSTIGHKCRELLQIFTTEIIDYKKIEVRNIDITHTKNRLNEILSSLNIGKTKPKFIKRNYDYIDVLIDLVQRQEHAGTKENEVLIWNDARRIIIHCVMYIIDLIDLFSEYS
ncbi:MAG: hypothetical protein KAU01_06510 [Candidatus Cloacimonetes bacterium]|nr:hypothetical protein [Candidatus Cloacimonadota bacterium]